MFNSAPGILTTTEWLFVKHGSSKRAFYAPRWEILTDKEFPVVDFRSSERWSAVAYDEEDNFLAIIPGCKVAGFVRVEEVPLGSDICKLSV